MFNNLIPGDIKKFEQKDGNVITIHVGEQGIVVKAEHPGTTLKIERGSHFAITAKAVQKDL